MSPNIEHECSEGGGPGPCSRGCSLPQGEREIRYRQRHSKPGLSYADDDISWTGECDGVEENPGSGPVNQPTEGREPNAVTKVEIVDFRSEHADAFRQMNLDWINHYWEAEDADRLYLDHPRERILDPGGAILIALYEGEPVGAVALIQMGGGSYELAKMAVDERARGKGIGWLLGTALLARAREVGATRVYLESNTILEPAINLYRKLGFEQVKGRASPYDRCNIQMEIWLT
jgi:GNAT superfamily N-acetyltransferase